MEQKIVDILTEVTQNTIIKDNPEIDLLENDILDSLAFITLIERLEEEFNIEIQPTKVKPDNWRTAKSITKLCEKIKMEE